MTRTVAILAAVAAVGMLAAVLAGGIAVSHAAAQETPANETAEPVGPGAQLSGVVAVQGVEVSGELSQRRFGHQIATARSNASRVAVVADRVRTLQTETDALRERRQALVEARQNGTIGPARFRAEMAALAARGGSIAASADQTEAVAAGLDRERLAERGVNATAIERLRTEARNASGPEAAAIARTIAGNDAGRGLAGPAGPAPGRPVDVPSAQNRTTDDGVTITLDTPTRPGGGSATPGGDGRETSTADGPSLPGTPRGPPTEVAP